MYTIQRAIESHLGLPKSFNFINQNHTPIHTLIYSIDATSDVKCYCVLYTVAIE